MRWASCRHWPIRKTTVSLMPNMDTQTKRTVNGLLRRLSAFLQDETYTGTLVQGKQGTLHYKIKQMEQRPSSKWIRVPDAHEALIPKQDFELVLAYPQTGYPHVTKERHCVFVLRHLDLRLLRGAHDAENEPGQGQGIPLLLLPHREKSMAVQSCDAQGERSGGVCQRQPEGGT